MSKQASTARNLLLLALLAGLLATGVWLAPRAAGSFSDDLIKASDFKTFWSAYRILKAGADPYDEEEMRRFQFAEIEGNLGFAHMVMPPWTVVLMGPVMTSDLILSARLWLAANCLLGIAAALLFSAAYGGDRSSRGPALLAVSVYLPIISNNLTGHLATALTFFIALFAWAMTRQRWVLAGLALVPLTIKPHHFGVLALAVAWEVLSARRFRIAAGFLGGLVLLMAITSALFPGSIGYWLGDSADMSAFVRNRTHTVSAELRILISLLSGSVPAWPMLALPAAGLLCFALWLLMSRPVFDWSRDFAPLLCLGLMLSPYAWLYDSASLLAVNVAGAMACLGPPTRRPSRLVLCVVFLALNLGLLASSNLDAGEHVFSLLPLVMLGYWRLLRGRLPVAAPAG